MLFTSLFVAVLGLCCVVGFSRVWSVALGAWLRSFWPVGVVALLHAESSWVEPVSLALASGFLPSGPPGKSFKSIVNFLLYPLFLSFWDSSDTNVLCLSHGSLRHLSFIFCLFSLCCSDCCCCSVARSCPTLCDPMDCSTPGFPVLHHLLEFAQTDVLSQWCHPTISSSVAHFSSIRFFSNESACCIRWPKYWSFNFSISSFQ